MAYVSDAEKIDTLAKMLAGYDDATWAKLRENAAIRLGEVR